MKKTEERANSADQKVLDLEEELKMIGDNMKQLEVSEENALKSIRCTYERANNKELTKQFWEPTDRHLGV